MPFRTTPFARVLYGRLGCCALLLYALPAHADIYSYVDEGGGIHFSDTPNDPRYQLVLHVVEEPLASALPVAKPAAMAKAFAREVALAAQSSQVEEALLHAVIEVESNYNPRAISAKGARGLMQLMPDTARAYGVRDALDAQQNINGGAQYLRVLLDRFGHNRTLALAAYNAGPAAVQAYAGQVPPYAETRSYVPAVLRRYQQNLLAQRALSDRQ